MNDSMMMLLNTLVSVHLFDAAVVVVVVRMQSHLVLHSLENPLIVLPYLLNLF